MTSRYSDRQLNFARHLRREMTNAEKMLWRSLRGSSLSRLKFRRQVPVGPYIADFLCVEYRLIIELDGPPHDDEKQKRHDEVRDAWLKRQGYVVIRFSNDLVIGGGNIVLEEIKNVIEDSALR